MTFVVFFYTYCYIIIFFINKINQKLLDLSLTYIDLHFFDKNTSKLICLIIFTINKQGVNWSWEYKRLSIRKSFKLSNKYLKFNIYFKGKPIER